MHNALMLLPAVYMAYMAGEHGEGHFFVRYVHSGTNYQLDGVEILMGVLILGTYQHTGFCGIHLL